MFGKEEQIVQVLGDVPDEKLTKETKKLEELLDKFYEDYYKRH